MNDPDVREVFAEAASWFAELVSRVPAGAWTGPGLGVWDVRALVGHGSRSLITVDTYLDRPVDTVAVETPWAYYAQIAAASYDPEAVAERGRAAGVALGEDPAQAVRDLASRVIARLPSEDPTIETIAGGMRLTAYLPTRIFELVVHGYDLAAAVQLEPAPLAESVQAEAMVLAARIAVTLGHGPQALLALTGRAPLPPGFSVV